MYQNSWTTLPSNHATKGLGTMVRYFYKTSSRYGLKAFVGSVNLWFGGRSKSIVKFNIAGESFKAELKLTKNNKNYVYILKKKINFRQYNKF